MERNQELMGRILPEHFLTSWDGAHIQFWRDKWLGTTFLKESYPRLFMIASNPDSTIAQNKEDNSWNLILRRNLNDWELEGYFSLIANIQDILISNQRRDRLKWGNSKEGAYSVKEGYLLLSSNKDLIDQWP